LVNGLGKLKSQNKIKGVDTMKKMNLILPMLCLSILVTGCATRIAGWEKKSEVTALSATEVKSFKEEAQKLWKGRADQASLENALVKFERLHATNPADLETLIYLTRGYYLLADGHLQDVELKKKNFETATSYGEKAMATNAGFKSSIDSGKSIEDSLPNLTKAEVPAIYWTAASLGKWAKANGIAASLKYKGRVKAMIERVQTLQSDYFYGAANRYWGAFYAIAPSFAGGDLNKSKQNFDQSIKIAPEYLGTKVLYAENYLTKKSLKKEFEEVLKEVLASKFDKHPELGPENTIEKKKAQRLLDKKDDLF
jgi:hypothetical protein